MSELSRRASEIEASPIRVMREKAAAMRGVARLEIGEPDFTTPAAIRDAAKVALDEGWTKYTPAAGIPDLRAALATYDTNKLGRRPDPAREVFVTMGGTHGLLATLMATVDPGDDVLVPDPGWPPYLGIVRLAGANPIRYHLAGDEGFAFEASSVERAITPRTRAIIINSPSNPTGRVAPLEFLQDVAEIARAHDVWLISDEVYEKLTFDGVVHRSIAAVPAAADRTVVVNSFSKTFAMTGWRIGHITAPGNTVDALIKLQGFITACPNAMAQRAGITAVTMDQEILSAFVEEYRKRRDAVADVLADVDHCRFVLPEGTFYILLDLRSLGRDDKEIALSLLEDARVSSMPGSSFGAEAQGFLRLSFASSMEDLLRAGEAIASLKATRR